MEAAQKTNESVDSDKAIRDESPEKKTNPIMALDLESNDPDGTVKPENNTVDEKTTEWINAQYMDLYEKS